MRRTGSTNANIVMIDGAKTAGMYKVINGAGSSNLTRITQFGVTTPGGVNAVWPLKPKWSPDCSKIAFLAWDRSANPDNPPAPSKTSVYVINLTDNTHGFVPAALPVKTLTDAGVYKVYDYNSRSEPAWVPNWSADGSIVSYSVDTALPANQLDLSAINTSNSNIVQQLYSGSVYNSYLEYINDQPVSQGAVFSPQLVGQTGYSELDLVQCPSDAPARSCPNSPTRRTCSDQVSGGTGAYLRMLTLGNDSTVTANGGLLFQDGIVTAVFPPNVLASDTVFLKHRRRPSAAAAPAPASTVRPTRRTTSSCKPATRANIFPNGTRSSVDTCASYSTTATTTTTASLTQALRTSSPRPRTAPSCTISTPLRTCATSTARPPAMER